MQANIFQDMLSERNVNWKDKVDMLSHDVTWTDIEEMCQEI